MRCRLFSCSLAIGSVLVVLLLAASGSALGEDESTRVPEPVTLHVAFLAIDNGYGLRSTPPVETIEGVTGLIFFPKEGTMGFWVEKKGLIEQRIKINTVEGIGWSNVCPEKVFPVVGEWTYEQGSFSDVHIYHADGTVTAPASAEAHATWQLVDGVVVTLWHNGWKNRLFPPFEAQGLRGESIDPNGATYPIALTRR